MRRTSIGLVYIYIIYIYITVQSQSVALHASRTQLIEGWMGGGVAATDVRTSDLMTS